MHSKSPMFKESTVYKPFNYPWAVDLAVLSERMHWIEHEINLAEDISDWKQDKLSIKEKEFITQILRLFTQSDVAVGSNYYNVFIPEFKNNEIRAMLGSFSCREFIHQRSYSLLNDSLGLPEGEYSAFLDYVEMRDKIEFMLSNDNSTQEGMGLSIVKAVFNEGLSLFASFIMLFNFQRFGKMKGMGQVVEFSIKDETLHCAGMVKLFRVFCEEHRRVVNDDFKKAIYNVAKEVVKLEDKFIDLAFNQVEIEGLSAEDMKTYIRYIADRRLIQLGMKGIFKVKTNNLPWTEHLLNAPAHTNFFEQTVTDYSKGSLTGEWGYGNI